ncbi:MAG: hypothetical protein H8F28_26015 [Fibrella sp.]|nr:hypothetical protein [Armatimonadota bacterium]
MFKLFMILNQDSFGKGYHDAAYHALAAALDVAQQERNREGLARIVAIAATQNELLVGKGRNSKNVAPSTDDCEYAIPFSLLAQKASVGLNGIQQT